jgi:hypothetical protein
LFLKFESHKENINTYFYIIIGTVTSYLIIF